MILQTGQILIQAVIVALLARIAVVDFKTQKIRNRDVMLLAALGLAGLVLQSLQQIEWLQLVPWRGVYVSVGIALALFIVLLPFWLAKKVGAGDVKLMAAVPLVAGAENMLPFALLLLVFAAITAFVVKNPMMLPPTLFRQYVEHFERKGVVPFGVPIAASLIGVEVLRAFSVPTIM